MPHILHACDHCGTTYEVEAHAEACETDCEERRERRNKPEGAGSHHFPHDGGGCTECDRGWGQRGVPCIPMVDAGKPGGG